MMGYVKGERMSISVKIHLHSLREGVSESCRVHGNKTLTKVGNLVLDFPLSYTTNIIRLSWSLLPTSHVGPRLTQTLYHKIFQP